METGEWLTRGTVWAALTLYAAAEVVRSTKRDTGFPPAVRWLTTAGCAVFVAHVACAFAFYHQWSHAAAYADTARETASFTGLRWGGGLYFNYAFALAWLAETVWSWVNPDSYLNRPKWITCAVRGFFLFMILNGAVVFAHGHGRWYGSALCLILAVSWWHRKIRRPL